MIKQIKNTLNLYRWCQKPEYDRDFGVGPLTGDRKRAPKNHAEYSSNRIV